MPVIFAMGTVAGYTATSGKCRPMYQMSGTRTKFERAPPAHRSVEARRPMT